VELSERSLFFMSLTTKERGSLCSGGDWKEDAGDKDEVLAGETAERDAVLPGETVETSSESIPLSLSSICSNSVAKVSNLKLVLLISLKA